IIEYLVKISKKARILKLKRRNMKITDSDNQYGVSIKEDTTRAVIDATQCKRVKYEAKCADIGYGFLPFLFSSLISVEFLTFWTPVISPSVSALETKMSEFRQTNQFAEAIFSIHGIVDNYLASKMKDTVDVVVQLQTNNIREETQAENYEFLNQRGRDDQDKDKDPSVGLNRGSKGRRYGKEAESSKEPTHKESKSTSSSKGATRSQPKSSAKFTHAKERG
nr:hypothetical protein [Tanacetum cinerariifolium]